MVRNEPFIFHALASVAPFVDEIIIHDTGSTDDTVSKIERAIKLWPDKIKFKQVKLPDAHAWVASDLDKTVNWEVGKVLGNIRREQHESSKGKYTWILDGDEVYPSPLAAFVSTLVADIINQCKLVNAIFIPFLDFVLDTRKVRQYHSMGRVFLKDTVEITGSYPVEMHRLKGSKKDLCPGDLNTISLNAPDEEKCFHFESLVKPWRKTDCIVGTYHGKLPEVFEKFPEETLLLKEYLK
jgi:glycosyltransferase involved in cell wall biosynthesis